ncbi:unnamed protein product, partial [Brassica rapa subsp. trilocularis]
WVDVWKWRSHLVLDMNKVLETTPNEDLHRVSVELARSMTKHKKSHREEAGDIEYDDRDFFVSSDEEVQCGSSCGQVDKLPKYYKNLKVECF